MIICEFLGGFKKKQNNYYLFLTVLEESLLDSFCTCCSNILHKESVSKCHIYVIWKKYEQKNKKKTVWQEKTIWKSMDSNMSEQVFWNLSFLRDRKCNIILNI